MPAKPRRAPRRGAVVVAALLSCLAGSLPPAAGAVAGDPPRALRLDGAELDLAGCAVRRMYGTELYALAVYLPRGEGRGLLAAEADPRGPVALWIAPLHGRDSAPFPRGWRRRLADRIAPELLQGLERVHAGLRPGESVLVAYQPRRATTRVLKGGATLLAAPGEGLLRAMLAMWLHDDPPISEEIRQALLSGRCDARGP